MNNVLCNAVGLFKFIALVEKKDKNYPSMAAKQLIETAFVRNEFVVRLYDDEFITYFQEVAEYHKLVDELFELSEARWYE